MTASEIHTDSSAKGGSGGPRVLIVEDSQIDQMVAFHMLKRLGCEVHLAEDGTVALDLMLTHDYNLILIDCDLPVMDGYETTRRIRRRGGESATVPIVALAGSDETKRCLDAGMNDCVIKPLSIRKVVEVLESWCPDRKK